MLQITTKEGCICPLCEAGLISRSSISQHVLDKVQLVPCPEPIELGQGHDPDTPLHYKRYAQVVGKPPVDTHRPSYIIAQEERRQVAQKAGAVSSGAKAKDRVESLWDDRQIRADEDNKAILVGKYARHFVVCGDPSCNRREVVFCKTLLSNEERASITASTKDWWECGQPLCAEECEGEAWATKAFVRQKVTCDCDLSLLYFNKLYGLTKEEKMICGNCGLDLSVPGKSAQFENSVQSTEVECTTMAPQCIFCLMEGRARLVGRRKAGAKRVHDAALVDGARERREEDRADKVARVDSDPAGVREAAPGENAGPGGP